MWRKENLPILLVGIYKLLQPLWQTKNKATYDPAIPLLSIYTEKNHTLKKYMHPKFNSNTIYRSQDIESTQISVDRGKEEDVVHIYNGILLSHKNNEIIISNKVMNITQS